MSNTVLLVDDSELIRHSLRVCIEENSDWTICGEAENGQVAVEKVGELHPDVVILDLQMPVMDGLEAARQISHMAPNTAMVMLTAYVGTPLAQQAHDAGINDVFSKFDGLADHLLASLEDLRVRGEFRPGSD
jgi:DNA-binding NarL/FixJ family response regulator